MLFKKIFAVIVCSAAAVGVAACGGDKGVVDDIPANPVTLNVVTTFGEGDGNYANYKAAYLSFERNTGHTIKDDSAVSNEKWKRDVIDTFKDGTEPDVLFFFVGADANEIIASGNVIPIKDIRAKYPNYAANMKDGMIPKSPFDGVQYAVPVNGIWEALYVNNTVLSAAGAAMPGENTTWDEFMTICQKIKDAGYAPIAVSLGHIPHYVFEYAVFNNASTVTHAEVPKSVNDLAGQIWIKGLNDIKSLFEKGFFPDDTLTSLDDETVQMFADGKAAFLIDGSWKIGWFQSNAADRLGDFSVTYFPGRGERKSTDIISDLSMGYYITRNAWDNADKRPAAVAFVEAMTTDEVVSKFGATSVTALKNGAIPPFGADSIMLSALEMTRGASGTARATQDGLTAAQRTALFELIDDVVSGNMSASDALETALKAK